MHTHDAQAVVVTDRFSSNDLDLKNILIPTVDAGRVREAAIGGDSACERRVQGTANGEVS